jgi:hypothetical protein
MKIMHLRVSYKKKNMKKKVTEERSLIRSWIRIHIYCWCSLIRYGNIFYMVQFDSDTSWMVRRPDSDPN